MDRSRKSRKKISRRDFVGRAGLGAAALVGASAISGSDLQAQSSATSAIPTKWDLDADVVVLGAGACGLPAAIRAADHGASVIVVDANYDIGGHGIINGGQVLFGGGTSAQKKYGIVDSPDILFKDLTDWSVVETNGIRNTDTMTARSSQRALADNEAAAYEFLLENGVKFEDGPPGVQGRHAIGISVPRENYAEWDKGQSLGK
jgi:succinate dehydrogenase/fumarate reductase flavoprotein subunit